MTTPDHIARAAEVLNQSVVRQSINDDISITVYLDGSEFEETLARALDAAGLLRRPDDPEVDIETTEEGCTCVVKVHGQVIFDGVCREDQNGGTP